jgi:rhodanese-related sulfurtransferase
VEVRREGLYAPYRLADEEDKEIVAYCRGPYCVFSDEAVRALRAQGYRASRLTDGATSSRHTSRDTRWSW